MGAYNWSTVDRNQLTAAGVTMTGAGAELSTSSFKVLPVGTVLVATAPAGKMFNPSVGGAWGDYPSIAFGLENPINGADKGHEYFVLSNNNKTATYTIKDINSNTDYAAGSFKCSVVDAVAPAPLEWDGAMPVTAHVGDKVLFKWKGGTPRPVSKDPVNNGYAITVRTQQGGTNILPIKWLGDVLEYEYTFPPESLGAIYVRVYDDSDNITNNMTIEAALPVVTPLVWGSHPDTVEVNIDAVYTWSGGDAAKGYNVIVLESDKLTEVDNDTIPHATPTYTLNHPTAGTYFVQVYIDGESHTVGADKLEQQVIITPHIIPPDYTFKDSELQQLTDSHITLKAGGVEINASNKGIHYGDSLVATVPADWNIQELSFEADNDFGNTIHLEFIVAPDSKSATVTFNRLANQSSPFISFSARATQVVITKGSNNVYAITQDDLDQLNDVRFVRLDVATTAEAVYDYGEFILGLIEVPFSIDPAYIGQPESIRLANFDTKVHAPVVKTDRITVDLGDISIAAGNSKVEDFSNTVAILHLPYAPAITLDVDYVIGETVHVEYVLDAYNGKCNVNISSTKVGAVIQSVSVDLGIQIPYTTLITGKTAENTSIVLGGDNHIRTPFIEIVRANAVLPNGLWTIPVSDEDILGNHTGYIQVEEIEFKTEKALRVEKQEIISLLNSGVIIK